MKLLIITQKVDQNDPVLGFFHRWIAEFSKKCESIVVICLQEGKHNLPGNVKVLSLGKEQHASRLQYVTRFFTYIWHERNNYDAAFVHMNQEYILLGGWFWKLIGKPVFMWRNHYSGTFLTDMAAAFCTHVFCTSKHSYTAKYSKTILMPVGVDAALFNPDQAVNRIPHSILFFGRVAPSKNPHILIEALLLLKQRGKSFTASIYGNALPADLPYHESLKARVKELGLEDTVRFVAGVPNDSAPAIFAAHEISVNLSRSGMYDKTMFEAMACGTILAASNDDLRGQIDGRCLFAHGDAVDLANTLEKLMDIPAREKDRLAEGLRNFAASQHGLASLAGKVSTVITEAISSVKKEMQSVKRSFVWLAVFVACAVTLVSISVFAIGPSISTDSQSYAEAIGILQGHPVPPVFAPARILTSFLGLELIRFVASITGSIFSAWLFVNTTFYLALSIFWYLLIRRMFGSDRVAFLAGLFLSGNYALLMFGPNYLMDIGGWSFYIFSLGFLYFYSRSGKPKDLFLASLMIGIGGLFKEYGFLGAVAVAAFVIWEYRSSLKMICKRGMQTASLALIPALLVHAYVYIRFGYSYADWLHFNHNAYGHAYASPLIEYFKAFGSLINFLAFPFLAGLWITLKSWKGITPRLRAFLISCGLSFLPVFIWPAITQRILFPAVPFIIFIACFAFKKYEPRWYLWLPLAVAYILMTLFMDSYVLKAVNLPF